ncbi:MAG: flagellar hook-basal body complex protein FliE [Alphaproteobacteria bacterium]
MVGNALQSVEDAGHRSESMAVQAVQGKADLADVVTSLTDAETALTTIVSLRDKAINAYQDIIKMPI